MAKPRVRAGGGWAALRYVWSKGRESGGVWKLYRRLRTKNVCKTCALGMGGQQGGMVNEAGRFPEVCKKSVQAQAGDMAGAITEDFFRRTSIDTLARYTSADLERLGRLTFPVIAEPGDTHFRRIGWDDALDRTAAALRDAPPEEAFFYASGRSSNEAAFLFQLVGRAFGTANIHNCSYYCHNASGVALNRVYGSGTASVVLDDVEKTDLVIVIGANPASNHPRLLTLLMKLRRRGGKVLVINPLEELGLKRFKIPSSVRSMLFGTTVSDLYVTPHIGGDVPLLKGVLKALVAAGGVDRAFVDAHTDGFDAVLADVEAAEWGDLETASGVARADIERIAAMVAAAPRGIACWAMGLTHHTFGVDNVLALANVVLARGWLGREGAGLMPIRGHSNVQGVGSVGVGPAVKRAFAEKLESLYGITIPPQGGQDTYASMCAAHDGRIRAAVLLGGNLFGSNPDRTWAGEALMRVPVALHATTKLNEGHVHGRGQTAILVPVLARDEESQATTQESMFNLVRMSDGGTPAVDGELRSEVDVIASLAERILPGDRFDWSALRSHATLREQIARVVPGYGPIDRVGDDALPHRGEFQIPGRTFHTPAFATPTERAQFAVTPLPDWPIADDEFRLMTIRSEGQFNSVVYDEEDLYRGATRRDAVLMAAEDAARLGVGEDDAVVVENETGRMTGAVSIATIRPGNVAMYYPEANILVPRRIDPLSKTPAFKSVAVRIRRPQDEAAARR